VLVDNNAHNGDQLVLTTYTVAIQGAAAVCSAQQSTNLFDVAKEELLPQVVALIEDDRRQEGQKEDGGAETDQRIL
jgi:hypothetical protein